MVIVRTSKQPLSLRLSMLIADSDKFQSFERLRETIFDAPTSEPF